MPFAAQGFWTLGRILELIVSFAILGAILCGITLIFIAGFYFARVAREHLEGRKSGAQQERAAGARQARHLALMSVVCGPIFAIIICLGILPAAILQPGFRFLDYVKSLPLVFGLLSLAGLIAGGAFLATSALLGQVRKTVKKWKRGGVWDPDLDGLA